MPDLYAIQVDQDDGQRIIGGQYTDLAAAEQAAKDVGGTVITITADPPTRQQPTWTVTIMVQVKAWTASEARTFALEAAGIQDSDIAQREGVVSCSTSVTDTTPALIVNSDKAMTVRATLASGTIIDNAIPIDKPGDRIQTIELIT